MELWWEYLAEGCWNDEEPKVTKTTDKSFAREETRRLGRGVFWERTLTTERPIFVGPKPQREEQK